MGSKVKTEAEMNEINQLTASLDQANNQINGLKQANGSLTEKIDVLESENAALKTEVEESKSQIESLKSEIAVLLKGDKAVAEEKKNGVGETFIYDEVEYQLLAGAVHVPGFGRLTALEILATPEAQQKLISIESGVIKKLS